ncbi:MAG: LexA family transcriptional regulator [bacterium]
MDRQKEYSQIITRFYRESRRLPSYSELLKLTGLKSKNAVYGWVQKFLQSGLISKDSFGKLIPGPLLGRVPILGLVEAGFPVSAEEDLQKTVSLDEFLIGQKEASYILEVSGDSMTEAGIMPGDLVLVERGRTPRVGDIVVAEVDNEWTLKYFRKQGQKVFLEAANKKYPKFYPHSELVVAAVVRGVVRKYQ